MKFQSILPARWVVVLSCVAFVVSGCKALSDFLAGAFQKPGFNFKTLGLNDISLAGLTLDTVWQLDNPNKVGLSLASVKYALAVEDKQVVAGAPPNGLQIPAAGSTDMHFPAAIKFQDLVGVVQTFLTKDSGRYKAEGELGIQTPIGVIAFPISKEGEFEVPKVPDVQFGSPRVSKLDLSGATIEFPLNVTNKNTFALPVSGLGGALKLAGASVGNIDAGNLGAMDGKGVKQVTVPLKVSFLSAGMGLYKAISSGNAQLQFDAQVQSGGQALPINVNQLVNLVK
jgi:LEA14-like dessication related protein